MSLSFEYCFIDGGSIELFIDDDDLTQIALQHWEEMIIDQGLSAAIETVIGSDWQEAEVNLGVYTNNNAILKKLKSDPDVIRSAQDDAIDLYKERSNA